MVAPVPSHPKITTKYGVPGAWIAGYHTGDDYGSPGIDRQRVVATTAGTVVYSGRGGGWGNSYGEHVIIDSGNVRHMYAHLSVRRVSYGQKVVAGQEIGLVGNTGNSTGPHTHYEERTGPGFRYGVDARLPLFSHMDGGLPSPSCYGDYCYGKFSAAHRALQRRLADKGHVIDWGDWPTPYYGESTKAAVAAFQRAQGWSGSGADGLMGPMTCDKLGLPQNLKTRGNGLVYASKMRIGQGDSDSVWNVQVALLLRGFSIPAGPTDYFGNQTVAAVKEFQTEEGWSADLVTGIPDESTIKALGDLQWVQDVDVPKPPVDPIEPPVTQPDDLFPNAVWDPVDGMAGLRPFSDGPGQPKVVMHTTETAGKPNWQVQMSGLPHFTIDPSTNEIWQHLPLDVAAYTLRGGEHSPNSSAGVSIQIEIVGRAEKIRDYDQDWYDNLKPLLVWCCAKIGAPYAFPFPFTGNLGYGEGGEVRQTWTTYQLATGIVCHANVPYNLHWDVGDFPIERITDRVEPPVVIEPPVIEPPPVEPAEEYLTVAQFMEWVQSGLPASR